MATNNYTAAAFIALKNRLVAEFTRRNQNGSLASSSTTMTPTPSQGTKVLATAQGTALIDDALKIEDITGMAKVQAGDKLPDMSALETKLTT